MDAMKTYYKPTEWQGKRVVYASIDPAERKRQTVIGWAAISVVLGFIVFVCLLSRWSITDCDRAVLAGWFTQTPAKSHFRQEHGHMPKRMGKRDS
jgi:hypothetical protein